ncbi:DNA-binding NarL/FixJ family response regulator [Labrenzia sp. EL_208]|nr:DNA-binding NarL/FixJ family response regulator [Labrenzia sp. EL_132]MBG6233420.1 DNA-binding NarL/FixJ family response regulator [Labrenzia sp. EL_208]
MDVLSRLPYIYNVATSDSNWATALDHFGEATGSKGVAILARNNGAFDFGITETNSLYADNWDLTAQYREKFRSVDEYTLNFCFKAPPYERIEDNDFWPGYFDLADREDLKFLYEKFGVFRRAAYNISATPALNAVIGLQYDKDIVAFDPGQSANAQTLAVHLGKALEINRFCFQLRQKYKAVLTVLDNVDAALCILFPTGEVVVFNRKAQKIFEERNGISLTRENHLVLRDEEQTARLRAYAQECCQTAAGRSSQSERLVKANKTSLDDGYLIEISPLRDGDNELNENLSGAMMTIIDPMNPPKLSVEAVAKLRDLTKAETDVSRLLIEGRTIPEISEIRRVSVATVRNQARSIHLKLDVRNRAELIRKVTSVSPPIA